MLTMTHILTTTKLHRFVINSFFRFLREQADADTNTPRDKRREHNTGVSSMAG